MCRAGEGPTWTSGRSSNGHGEAIAGTTGLTAQFSPDATGLAITSDDGNAWLVDLATGEYEPLPFGTETGVTWQRLAP